MTLVIGVRCKDGILLMSDSKAVRGDDESGAQKIIKLLGNQVIVGVAGSANLLDKLIRQLGPDIEYMKAQTPENERDKPLFKGKEHFIGYLETKMKQFSDAYQDNGDDLALLIAINDGSTVPTLHAIELGHPTESEIHEYLAIGHGSPYSKLLMKTMWKKDMTMIQTASLVYFIFKVVIEIKLDITVGGNVQAYIMPYSGVARELTPDEIGQMNKKMTEIVSKFNSFVVSADNTLQS